MRKFQQDKSDFPFFLVGHCQRNKGMLITQDIYRVSYKKMVYK